MQIHLVFVATLFAVKCAGEEANANDSASAFSLAYGSGNNVDALNALSQSASTPTAANALNSLSALIKGAGGNYIIDASSLGGQILISRGGNNLAPIRNTGPSNTILTQLLQNIAVPLSEGQSNTAEHSKNVKSVLSSKPPPSNIVTRMVPIPKPYPVTITRSVAIPKPYPVAIPRPVPVPVYIRVPNFIPVPFGKSKFHKTKVMNPVPDILPNPILLKILETSADDD